MCPHRRKCDDGRDIREGIRGRSAEWLYQCADATRKQDGVLDLSAYIPVRSMSGPQYAMTRDCAEVLPVVKKQASEFGLAGGVRLIQDGVEHRRQIAYRRRCPTCGRS